MAYPERLRCLAPTREPRASVAETAGHRDRHGRRGLSIAPLESGRCAISISCALLGTVRTTRSAVPLLAGSGSGAIVNISSIRGMTGSKRPAYAAVKAAIINFTISEALALADRKIRVNAIAPGSIEFPGGLAEAPIAGAAAVRCHSPTDPSRAHGRRPRGRERGAIPCERSSLLDARR